jgi:uncharacterized membrane protein YccC
MDRSLVSTKMAVRNTLGVVLPLAVGAATGQVLGGLTMAVGALNVSFSDGTDAYRTRAARLLAATVLSGISVFAGATAAGIGALAIALAALWSFAVGMLVLFGSTPAQLGVTTLILLLVFGAEPMSVAEALATAGLVCAGGLLQTLIAISAWPTRGFAPERRALAGVARTMSEWASGAPHADLTFPASEQLSAANDVLTTTRIDHGPVAEALVSVLNQLERMRLALVSLDEIAARLEQVESESPGASAIRDVMRAAADELGPLAESLVNDDAASGARDAPFRLDAASEALREIVASEDGTSSWLLRSALERTLLLRAQLHAAVEMGERALHGASLESFRVDLALPRQLRPYGVWRRFRANLTFSSAAFRHAARLVVCIMLAKGLAVVLDMPHAYWIPMTVAIVLKPDFTATFTRGMARLAGTLAGLLAMSLVLHVVPASAAWYIALVALATFAVRGIGRSNYAILVFAVTALIVVLLAIGGAPALPSMEARGMATLVGGALALAAYVVWPTWERSQTPLVLATMLDSYRDYFDAVLAALLAPAAAAESRFTAVRRRARLARSNADASVDRLYAEPRGTRGERSGAMRLLAASRRFTRATMVLEAGVHVANASPLPREELGCFARDVDVTLIALASALRGQRAALESLPQLLESYEALRTAAIASEEPPGDDRKTEGVPQLWLGQIETIANAINTMVALMV